MKKKILIAVLAIIGFITTIKLALIYFNANFNPYALSSFCSVNEFIDCDGIAKTTESQFFGIPLAYWGMFLYLFMCLLLVVDKLKNFRFLKFLEVFKNPLSYIAALGLISFCISMILLVLSLFEIKKLCVLCAFTYLINFLIGCIAVDFKLKGFAEAIKQSFTDFIDALKIKKYLAAFIVVMLIAGGFLTYTTTTMVFAPQVKRQLEFGEFIHAKRNKYAVSGNVLGSENPKVTVYVYSDYQCPICFAHNIMMHKLTKELKDISIVHKNLPLDTDCNRYLRFPMHQGACTDAKYSIAAEKQGRFWDMNDILFEHKPQTEAEILELAKDKGFDVDKLREDANAFETLKKIEADIEEAHSNGIDGTPAVVINDKVYIGIKPYKEYLQLIKDANQK